ncbi:hypothetical protein ABB37_00437 [Leptomonas pyrrhocoris]|uniref:Uncharacterized protein n=1 Tax=Leptomonas pyrrhocoris TaxID=157538 RepID=A0A0N0E097_LEPPY|nr:hypothetical protein ABB37_00437 [Leptomonas pyrrhocoris]KPA86192.1 hypothetical protein ABB37_00437 [Leptomonas pyrrhocoris]|eukprot:XP_015664631.1 hypothetical protein ABB37_00437 [Leptomonas pyrrhocoris]
MVMFTTASDARALCRAIAVNAAGKSSSLKTATTADSANDPKLHSGSKEPLQGSGRERHHCRWTVIPLREHANGEAMPLKSSQKSHLEPPDRRVAALRLLRRLQCELKQRTTFLTPHPDPSPPPTPTLQETATTKDSAAMAGSHTSDREGSMLRCRLSTAVSDTEAITCDQPAFVWSETNFSDGTVRFLNGATPLFFSEQEIRWDEGDGADAAQKQSSRNTQDVSFLCLDLGGLYTAAPPSPSPSPLPHRKQGTKRTQHTSPAPSGQCDTTLSPTQKSPTSESSEQQADGSATASLVTLLQQRFSYARASFPFDQSSVHALTLKELWVVPLSACEVSAFAPQSRSPFDYFPTFVVVEGESSQTSKSSISRSTSTHEAPSICVRIAQHTPELQLHLPQHQYKSMAGQRKRRRGEGEAAVGSRALPQDPDDAPVLLCAPEKTRLRFRVVASAFLAHSCYFSRWCCAEDFDVTHLFTGGGPYCVESNNRLRGAASAACTSRHQSSFHVFYTAMQHSMNAENAFMREVWTALWRTGDASATEAVPGAAVQLTAEALPRALRSSNDPIDARSAAHASDFVRRIKAADDLFDDTDAAAPTLVFATRGKGSNAVRPPVWPVEVLWNLWTRLGWTPPRLSSSFLVQLCGVTSAAAAVDDQSGGPPRCMTPAEWSAFVGRCTEVLDERYVQETLAGPEERSAHRVAPLCGKDGDGENGDVEAEHDDGFSRASDGDLLSERRTQILQMKLERLDTLRHIFSMRSALLSERSRQGLPNRRCKVYLGNDHVAVPDEVGRLFAGLEETAASDRQGADNLPLYVGPAAQALAADIAATIPTSAKTHSPAHEKGPIPTTFSSAWAFGVLESPAFPLPSSLPDVVSSALDGATRIRPPLPSRDASTNPSASAMNELLRRRPSHTSDQTRSSLPGDPDDAVCTELLSAEDAYCEVVDIAELRWRAHPGAVPEGITPGKICCHTTNGNKGDGDGARCACCCSLACQHAAIAAASPQSRGLSGQGLQTCLPTAPGVHTLTDPTVVWLSTTFVNFLKKNGVPEAASQLGTGESGPSLPFSAADQGEDEETNASEKVNDQEENVKAAWPTGETLTALLTDTIVRAVQQNKAVVRRLMQLVHTYESTASAAAAGKARCARGAGEDVDSDGHPDRADPAAEPERGATHNAALTCAVWRCLSAAEAVDTRDEANAYASSAKQLAIRQLQNFWASVAALTRQSVLEKYGVLSVGQQNKSSLDEPSCEDDGEVVNEEEEEADTNSCAAFADGDVELCQGEESWRGNELGAAASGMLDVEGGSDWVNSAASSRDTGNASLKQVKAGTSMHTLTADTTPPSQLFLPTASANMDQRPPTQLRSCYTAFVRAVGKLDGLRAMQLYMQRVITCTADGGAAALPSHNTQSDALLGEWGTFIDAPIETSKETHLPSAPATFAQLLQPHLWLRHALFLLSYAFAGACTESTKGRPPTSLRAKNSSTRYAQGTTAVPSSRTQHTSANEVAKGATPVVSPRLAAFRVLRNGKLALDSWILAAVEEYTGRWHRVIQRLEIA